MPLLDIVGVDGMDKTFTVALCWLDQGTEDNYQYDMNHLRALLDPQLLYITSTRNHLNTEWIGYCYKHRIILVIFPPYSTHRLQPLDVAIFSPLATAYSNSLDAFLRYGLGFTYMTKRHFWRLFAAAWDKALTEENIMSRYLVCQQFQSP